MMKKLMALTLCGLLMFSGLCLAEAVPSDQFFLRGKDALGFIGAGQVDEALQLLAFQYESPDQSDALFPIFLRDYLPMPDASALQRDVAVCYYEAISARYLLCIPLTEPVNDDVMALVLLSPDLDTFTGYAAMCWSEIQEGTASSQYVWWNVEYAPNQRALYAD